MKIPFISNWSSLLDLQPAIQHSPTIRICNIAEYLNINRIIIHVMAIFSYEKIIFRIEEIIFRIEKIIFRIEKIIFQYEKIILGMIKFLKRKYFPDFSYQKIFLSKENIPLPQNHPVLIMHKFFFLPIKSF